jgi:beta-lactamase superfamily II metal-dependent hydrolase
MIRMKRLNSLLILVALVVVACVPATPTAVAPQPGGALTVAFLDIGQGDATLIRAPNGMTMLIDGGNSNGDGLEVIIPQLEAWGADKLDVMVATHPDADHIGGLPAVIENFPVDTVALTGQVHPTQIYERFLIDVRDSASNAIQTRTGASIPFDPSVQVEVLGPDEDAVQDDDTNNASIVIKMTYGQITFLFTGDAEGPQEETILASGADLRSTVLKVGHHGSRSSTSEEWLNAVDPQVGVISAGENNRYGHPHQEVLDLLNRFGVQIYRTDQSGTITITTDGSTLDVQTEK